MIAAQYNYGMIDSSTGCFYCSGHQVNGSKTSFSGNRWKIICSKIYFFLYFSFESTRFCKILGTTNRHRIEFVENCQEIKAKFDFSL